jgi:dimethylargininase
VELSYLDRLPIDLDLAREQHAAYCELLARLGLRLLFLPTAPELPDAVFVEDVVVVVNGRAILTRPGAPSRRPEVADVGPVLEGLGLDVAAIEAPATLDGGDVLKVGDVVYVGMSGRTDAAAAQQLRALLEPLGRRVVPVGVHGALHLKTAVTALPDGTLIGVPDWVDVDQLESPVLPVPEPAGADVLCVGETVLVSASAPATAALLSDRGWAVEALDVSEMEKAEAGLTCMSVLF